MNGYTGANHSSVKRSNRATIFRAIHALGPVARVELARQTRLNPGTVSNIVDELLGAGLVNETGQGTSRVGRKPVFLEVNPTARYALGIDVARDAITGAVIDLTGQARVRFHEPAGPWLSIDIVLSTVCHLIERLLDALTPPERAAVVGIGIGAPGPLSIRSGRFLAPPSFGLWQELALQPAVVDRFRLPTYVDNNANTSTLAELWFGAGQGSDNFVLLTLGTGVGAGLVLDGDLYRGDHDVAGELGHVSVAVDGPRCACGNYGCLELYVSLPRVLATVRAALASGEPSMIRSLLGADGDVALHTVVAAATAGDPLANRVFADVARYLAAGIVTIVNTLDPRLVLLGRELASAGDVLLNPVHAIVRQRVIPALRDSVRIEAAALSDAPVIGAATLALREFFSAPLSHGIAIASSTAAGTTCAR